VTIEKNLAQARQGGTVRLTPPVAPGGQMLLETSNKAEPARAKLVQLIAELKSG
jgi:hypothetical protein